MFKPTMKKALTLLLIIALIVPGALFAANKVQDLPLPPGVQSGERAVLPAGETVKGPGFFAGNNVSINGNVDGTTFASGQTIEVTGKINGDLFATAQDVVIRGEVTGNIYSAGQRVQIDNHTLGDVFVAGQTVRLGEMAQAGRDVFAAGASVSIDGTIARQLFSGSESLHIGGTVGDDVYAGFNTLTFGDGAVIEGRLNYESDHQATVPETVTIQGEQNWKVTEPAQSEPSNDGLPSVLMAMLFALLSGLLIWLIVELIRPTFWSQAVEPLFHTPVKTLGFGLLAILVIIPLSIILMITVIGIPAAAILLGLAAILIVVSKIIAAAALNRWAIQKSNLPHIHFGVWTFLVALLIVTLLTKLPYIGFLFTLIAIFITFGIVVLRLFTPPYRPTQMDPKRIEPGYHHPANPPIENQKR